jgi:hypothetical protein
MKESENAVFVFPTRRTPGKAFFEILFRRLGEASAWIGAAP